MVQTQHFSTDRLSELTGCPVEGRCPEGISGLADLATAQASHLAFYHSGKLGTTGDRYRKDFEASQAGIIIVHPDCPRSSDRCYLLSSEPSHTFQVVLDIIAAEQTHGLGFDERIHPSAVIHTSAKVADTACIEPNVTIGLNCVIGAHSTIGANCVIGAGVSIGENCILHPNVTIRENCRIGDRVILQPGVVIGSCGFGYHTDASGTHHKLTHIGTVVIESDVEIGANTTIDRARFQETRIAVGSKIDNQVMLAHGVHVGPHNIIVSQSGIAGSTHTGRNVVIAAQVGVAGHLHLADQVMLGARAGVSKSLGAGQYQGAPAIPIKDYQRSMIFTRRGEKLLSALARRLDKIEQTLEQTTEPA